jgi:hypothetical protein
MVDRAVSAARRRGECGAVGTVVDGAVRPDKPRGRELSTAVHRLSTDPPRSSTALEENYPQSYPQMWVKVRARPLATDRDYEVVTPAPMSRWISSLTRTDPGSPERDQDDHQVGRRSGERRGGHDERLRVVREVGRSWRVADPRRIPGRSSCVVRRRERGRRGARSCRARCLIRAVSPDLLKVGARRSRCGSSCPRASPWCAPPNVWPIRGRMQVVSSRHRYTRSTRPGECLGLPARTVLDRDAEEVGGDRLDRRGGDLRCGGVRTRSRSTISGELGRRAAGSARRTP